MDEVGTLSFFNKNIMAGTVTGSAQNNYREMYNLTQAILDGIVCLLAMHKMRTEGLDGVPREFGIIESDDERIQYFNDLCTDILNEIRFYPCKNRRYLNMCNQVIHTYH